MNTLLNHRYSFLDSLCTSTGAINQSITPSHLSEEAITFRAGSHSSESARHVPETHVGAFRFFDDQLEPFWLLLNAPDEVLRQIHVALHLSAKAVCPFGPPDEPELEDVVVTAALDHLVARVVRHVVVFVLLEQVIGAHPVAVVQQTLQRPIQSYIVASLN